MSESMGGMVRVDGWMTRLAGAAFRAATEAFMPPPDPDDPRTPRQRRHDAIEDLTRHFLDHADTPTVGGEKPHVNVVCDLPALHAIAGGLNETEDGRLLTITELRTITCDCSLSRIVLGPDSEIIDVSRRTRVIPAAVRRAVIARDRHCTWPAGCDRNPRWCDVHHIQHWADLGRPSPPTFDFSADTTTLGSISSKTKAVLHHTAMHDAPVMETYPQPTMSADQDYTQRLAAETNRWWKRLLDVQAPYRRNLRRVVEGRVLDVGCGIGRNLRHLEGKGVGVDVNPHSVVVARQSGLTAYTAVKFRTSPDAIREGFDSLLFAHVLEHMSLDEASRLLAAYLPYLRPGGRVVIIVPQGAGFASDPTHVTFLDLDELAGLEAARGLSRDRAYSFPFPRVVGRFFKHNETVVLSRKT